MDGKTYSWSLKMVYSSSPTLTGLPPYCDLISLSLSLSLSQPLGLQSRKQGTHRRDQDAVARLDRALDALAVLVGGSGPDGENARLAQLLDRALGQEDSRRRLDVRFDALHKDAVQQRRQRLDVAQGGGLSYPVSWLALPLLPLLLMGIVCPAMERGYHCCFLGGCVVGLGLN